MAIKKVYQEIVAFLEDNPEKKVKSVLDEVISMCEAKRASGAQTYLKDAKGKVVAILDYYFKRWMPLVGSQAVEFGIKNGSSTGYNTMCKVGASQWVKQNRQIKNAKTDMLKELKAGTLLPKDIEAREIEIEAESKKIVGTDLGFATKEEVLQYLADEGVKVVE